MFRFILVDAELVFPCTCSLNDLTFYILKNTAQLHLSLPSCTRLASVHLLDSIFILTENELLRNEVSTVTTGEAVGTDSKSPPSLRRRKRTCSRRQGEKERESEVGGMGSGDRADRGVREQRDRREASKSAWK